MSQLTILRGYKEPDRLDYLSNFFRLPNRSIPLSELNATFGVHGTGQVFSGKLYLYKQYLSFHSYDKRSCICNIPLYSVRRVERLSTISQPSSIALSLILWHGLKLVLQLNTLKPNSDDFCNHLKQSLKFQLSNMKLVRNFSKGLYSEILLGNDDDNNQSIDNDNDINDNDNLIEIKDDSKQNQGDFHHGLGIKFKFPGDPKKLRERTKLKLWKEYFKLHGRNLTLVRYPQFNRLVQVGLPNRLRGEMWEILSGSIYERFENQGLYQKILDDHKDQSSMATDEIEKDLNRSLPEYGAYQDEEGINALRRVLTAYSWKNQELGYCQAMNILVAALLIYMSEEQAFWFLDKICNRILPGYYSASMYGTLLDQKVFEHLVQRTMPALHEHFVSTDIQLSVSSLPWFLSLYINSMPLVFAFRVIDCFVAFGSRVLFQVGLAALKINYAKLIEATDDGMVLNIFRDYFSKLEEPIEPNSKDPKISNITNFSELLVVAFREFSVITDDSIIDERRKFRSSIVKSIELFSKRSAIRNLKDYGKFEKESINKIFDHFFYSLCKTPTPLAALPPSTPSKTPNGEGESDRTETVIDLTTFMVFLSDIATWARDEKLIYNGFQERVIREVPESELIKKIFHSWDFTKRGALGLQDIVKGLNSVMFNDLLENIKWFFELHDNDKDGSLTKDELVQLSESLLFIFRSEPGDAYLGSVSKFMTNAFEYADSLIEQPQHQFNNNDDNDNNTNDGNKKPSPLSATEASKNCIPGSPNVNNDEPYINLPTFRMVVLADELLEAFFDTDLRNSFKFEDVPTSAIDQPLIDLSTLDDLGIGSTGLVGNILGGIFSKNNKEKLYGFADEIGKSIGKHQVISRPSFGRVSSDVSIEEKVKPTYINNNNYNDNKPSSNIEETSTSIVNGVANLFNTSSSWFNTNKVKENEGNEMTSIPKNKANNDNNDKDEDDEAKKESGEIGKAHVDSIKAAQEALANRKAFAIDNENESDDDDYINHQIDDDEYDNGNEFAIGDDEDEDEIEAFIKGNNHDEDEGDIIDAKEADELLNAPVDKSSHI